MTHKADANAAAEGSAPLEPPPEYTPSQEPLYPPNTGYNPEFINYASPRTPPQAPHTGDVPQPSSPLSPQHAYIPIPNGGYEVYVRQERTPLLHPQLQRERQFPRAALFFLAGCFFPFFWFLGICYTCSSNRYEVFWGKLNFFMAFMSLVASLIFTVVVIADPDHVGDGWGIGLPYILFGVTKVVFLD
ncbi:hypothetical protein BZG36_02026 [Bifiguratus adelaidae]|uniref:Uncharacterized protein n=1 Tax=Bifiguratus adelaidae TaxID=1938954 RepID=A0A261Y200_9FUNG|nr:hypothetical protein BZG36_02026 [Bifiguratus adelaidae]